MEINTNEPLNLISQLLIPVILIITTCIVQEPLKTYLSSHEKSQYIKILKQNFPSIFDFFSAKLDYKVDIFFHYFLFSYFGILLGIYITENLYVEVVNYLIDYWFSNFSYIESISFIENIGPIDIELITFSSLNVLIFIIFFGFPLYIYFIISQVRFKPQLTSHGKIKMWLKYVYSFHWLFFGFLIGVNLSIYHLAPYIFDIYSIHFIEPEYSNVSIVDLYTSMKTNLSYLQYIEAAFSLGMISTISCFILIYALSVKFSNRVIEKITDFYQPSFPYIKLKTGNGNIEGSLKDIQNKSLITLSENNVLTIVPWDKIEIMEVRHPAINEYLGADDSPADREITLIPE